MNEQILLRIGSTWPMDSIFLFVISPLGLIGFILNVYHLTRLAPKLSKSKQTRLYKYLTVYAVNSATLCLMHAFAFVSYSPRYFPTMAFNYAAKFYRCRILAYLSMSLCFFSSLLDIIIGLDRLSLFLNEKIVYLNRLRPYTKCVIVFLVCLIANAPLMLSIRVLNEEAPYCAPTRFARSKLGMALGLVLVGVRDLFTLALELIVFAASIFYYVKYSSKSLHIYYAVSTKSFRTEFKKTATNKSCQRKLILMSAYLLFISLIIHSIISILMYVASGEAVKDVLKFEQLLAALGISILLKHIFNVFIFIKFAAEMKKKFLPMDLFIRRF